VREKKKKRNEKNREGRWKKVIDLAYYKNIPEN